ncbi:hypothetical protein ACI2KS_07810 [Pseudomonas sp. NPDC087358]|uniref:hypothetical protein n=1 Tax=Pseudomonas sp. NPDC087358 TaxID=3364439 RepID=UPI003850FF66
MVLHIADDVLRSSRKTARRNRVRPTAFLGFTAGSRQIVGKLDYPGLPAESKENGGRPPSAFPQNQKLSYFSG